DVSFLKNGDLVVTWNGRGNGDQHGIFARVFSRTGTAITSEFLATEYAHGIQQDPTIAGDSTGGFWIAWSGRGADDRSAIYSRRFAADGTAQGEQFRVNQYSKSWQNQPAIAASEDGRVLIGWQSQRQDGSALEVYARLYSADGLARGDEFRVNETTKRLQYRPHLDFTSDGGFAVTWMGRGSGDRWGVYLREYNPNAVAETGEQLVNVTTKGLQFRPSIAGTTTGFVVSWSGRGQGDRRGVFASVYREQPSTVFDLLPIPDQTINEGQFLTVTPTLSAGSLAASIFAVVGSLPSGATLNTATGRIEWTPSEVQGPGSFSVTVTAQTADGQSDSESFTITVNEVNLPPALAAIADRTVTENTVITFTASAGDPDIPLNILTYSLTGTVPGGASINPTSGQFNWTPTEAQAPNTYPITVLVSDGVGGTDQKTFTVTVTEALQAPVLSSVGNRVIDELTLLTFTATATDENQSADTLTFALQNAPSAAFINPATGVFSWTPTEANGPGSFSATVVVTDSTGQTDSETITITVNEVNLPPVLTSIGNRAARSDEVFTFTATATDPDIPANNLTFSLDAGAPVGATIDPASGVLTWAPPTSAIGTAVPMTIRVTDNGSPALSDFETITISVNDAAACPFDDALTGWTVTQSGGSAIGQGTVVAQDCEAILTEGDSFVVRLSREFTVPATPSAITITFNNLNFDTTDSDFINDAFEMAFVDEDGNSIVQSYASGRDAFLNITEGLPAQAGTGIVVSGNIITVGLGGIAPGTVGKLILRLVNNDGDTSSSVTIANATIAPSDLPAAAPQNVLSALQPTLANLSSLQDQSAQQFAPLTNASVTTTSGPINTTPAIGVPLPFTPQVEWKKEVFTVFPEWNQVMMTPAVMDLNQDGRAEIIVSTFADSGYSSNGVLRAISGRDGEEVWSVTNPEWRVLPTSHVAVGDIDLDGYPDIVALHESFGLIAFGHDGSFKWHSDPVWGASYGGGPALADLDQDGVPEVIYGGTVLDNEGRLLWRGDSVGGEGRGGLTAYGGIGALSVVADIDLDGLPEVVAGKSAYRYDGKLLWNAAITDGYAAVGNFDANPYPEIVVITEGNAYLLDHLGEIEWGPVQIDTIGLGGAPTVADFDGDGMPEIGVAGRLQYTVLETNGSIKWTASTQENSGAATGSSVFDFDGDGRAEVVYGDEDSLDIYDGLTGENRYSFPRGNATVTEYPVVADVDGDGRAEIITVATTADGLNINDTTGIYVLGDANGNWVGTRPIWNQHTYHITNINDDGSIPTVEANSWEVYNNYRRNLQPTGTILGPPLISVSSPGSTFAAGTQVVLQGHATAQGRRSNGQLNVIDAVFINGVPVDVLDAAGNFFAQVTVQPGDNDFRFTAIDSTAQQVSATLDLRGVAPGTIDFTRYSDITGTFSGVF
ncbi:MAG: putative Ig domain-containing protein, partial [Planctomycetaceae bacterium]